jgi:hypothetical protein
MAFAYFGFIPGNEPGADMLLAHYLIQIIASPGGHGGRHIQGKQTSFTLLGG